MVKMMDQLYNPLTVYLSQFVEVKVSTLIISIHIPFGLNGGPNSETADNCDDNWALRSRYLSCL